MGFIGYFLALTLVGSCLHKADSFEDFINRVLHTVYLMSSALLICWLFFGQQVQFFTSLCLSTALAMCAVDYESSFDDDEQD